MPQQARPRELDFSRQPPHALQRQIVKNFSRFKTTVVAFGRQIGKSSTRPFAIVTKIARSKGFTTGAYVGPSHADAIKAFEEDLLNFGRVGLVKDSGGDDQDRHIDYYPIHLAVPFLPGTKTPHPDWCVCEVCADVRSVREANGGMVSEGCRVYYVAGGPVVHRGFQRHKLHWAIVDEDSHEAPELIEETLSAMFFTTNGELLVLGSPIPEGVNFAGFADLYQTGVPGSETYDPTVVAMNARSEDNPYADKGRIARERAALIAKGRGALAACLFDGKFATEVGSTFTNLENVFVLRAEQVQPDLWLVRDPRPSESFIVSIDFGRHDDSTVVWAISKQTLEAIGVMRIRRTEYLVQLPLIDAFVRRYAMRQIWSEGREEAAAELLRRMYGNSVNLVKWASGGPWDKATCVAKGMDLFERAAWKLPDIPWIREEFRKYERQKTPNGKWTYNAPKGYHDDSVAALLYATYGLPLLPAQAEPDPMGEPRFNPEAVFRASVFLTKDSRKKPFVLRRGA